MIKMIVLILCCLSCSLLAAPQQNVVSSITKQQGLPSNSVRDILFDRSGTVWFATLTGLARFDGTRFEVFKHQTDANSPPSSNIYSLLQDKHQRIWFSTNAQLGYYDQNTGRFSTPVIPQGRCNEAINRLITGRDGNIWGSNDSGMLFKYDLQKQTSQCVSVQQHFGPKHHNVAIYGLSYDKKRHGIWLATAKGLGFFDIKKQQSHFVLQTKGNAAYSLTAVFQDSQGHVWGGSVAKGIFSYNPTNEEFTYYSGEQYPQLKGLTISNVSQDINGRIWLSSNARGVYYLDNQNFHQFNGVDQTNHQPLPQTVFKVKHDPQGNIWLAAVGGVFIAPATIDSINVVNLGNAVAGNKQRMMISLMVDSTNKVIAGTTEGLFQFGANQPLTRLDDASLTDNFFGAVFVESSGDYLVCNASDLLRYHPQDKSFTSLAKGLGVRWCTDYWAQSDESLWIGTQAMGLVKFNAVTGEFDFISRKAGQAISQFSNSIIAVQSDGAGKLWLASIDNGFASLDWVTGEFKSYQHQKNQPNSLPGNMITDIAIDDEGYLWLATFNGLSRFDAKTQTFKNFSVKDGLSSEQLNKIRKDTQGDLWISSQHGLNLMNPKTLKIRRFYQAHGLADDEFNMGPAAKGPDGKLYFGGINGISIIDPIKLKQYQPKPRNFISGLSANNRVLHNLKGLPMSINDTLTRLSFDFGITAYTSLTNNQFRYRLKGLEQNWQLAGKTSTIDYSNLPYGDYVFEVQGKTASGQWITPSAIQRLTIVTPWYLTPLALACYAMLLLGSIGLLVYGFTQVEKRKAEKQQQKLQHTVDVQTASLSQQNQKINHLLEQQKRLFVQLSHEIRTPLTLILAPFLQLVKPGAKAQKQVEKDQLLAVARYNQNRLVTMLDQLLDIAQSGDLADEKKQPVVVADAINWVSMAVRPLCEQKQQQFDITLEEVGLVSVSKDAIEKVLLNLLVNAHKYTPYGGQIKLVALPQKIANEQWVVIKVSDNGMGIEPTQQSRIFECFERLPSTDSLPGVGVGLALAKQLVEANDGKITLVSEPGKGSCFSVYFRCDETLTGGKYCAPSDTIKTISVLGAVDSIDKNSSDEVEQNDEQIPTVLIVEDHPQMQDYLKDCLTPDYRILLEGDGQTGLACAIEQVPDIIISDIMMPVMDGFELLSAIKKHPNTSHIPVILLTAQSDPQSRLTGLARRADDYINKPFNEHELRLKLQNLLHLRTMWHRSFALQHNNIPVETEPTVMSLNPVQQKIIDQLNLVCEQHYQNGEFGIDDLAEHMNMGKRQLQRKIKALSGLSPITILNDMRLNKARAGIERGEQITQVAYSCGFNSYDYFSRVFKDKFGQSPKFYQ